MKKKLKKRLRKKYDKAMMKTAFIWAEESYCKRKQVGAILAKNGRILSTGYNGTITGADNCCEDEVVEVLLHCSRCENHDQETLFLGNKKKLGNKCTICNSSGYVVEEIKKTLTSKNTVVHAEANAIAFAGMHGIKTKGCSVYVTLSPCIECSKIMKQHGIKEVIYSEDYRVTEGIDFLREHGVKVRQIKVD